MVLAFTNVCTPVQLFGFVKLIPSVPVVVIVPPVRVELVATLVTVPFPLPLNVVQSVDVRSPVFTADAFRKREEVAIAEGTPEAPVMFPRTEFAAIAARPMVPVVVIVPPVMPLFVAMEVTVPEPPPPVLRQVPLKA